MGDKERIELFETIEEMFSGTEKTMMIISLLEINFNEDKELIMVFLNNIKNTYKNLNN